jgi:hypothetical protein
MLKPLSTSCWDAITSTPTSIRSTSGFSNGPSFSHSPALSTLSYGCGGYRRPILRSRTCARAGGPALRSSRARPHQKASLSLSRRTSLSSRTSSGPPSTSRSSATCSWANSSTTMRSSAQPAWSTSRPLPTSPESALDRQSDLVLAESDRDSHWPGRRSATGCFEDLFQRREVVIDTPLDEAPGEHWQ